MKFYIYICRWQRLVGQFGIAQEGLFIVAAISGAGRYSLCSTCAGLCTGQLDTYKLVSKNDTNKPFPICVTTSHLAVLCQV